MKAMLIVEKAMEVLTALGQSHICLTLKQYPRIGLTSLSQCRADRGVMDGWVRDTEGRLRTKPHAMETSACVKGWAHKKASPFR